MGRRNNGSTLASIILLFVGLATLLVPIILSKGETQKRDFPKTQTYTLVLTNASDADWLVNLRHREDTKIAVSGYPDDSPESVLQRIPWLLQPGVDTLIYDPDLAGKELVESLRVVLEEQSPATIFVARRE